MFSNPSSVSWARPGVCGQTEKRNSEILIAVGRRTEGRERRSFTARPAQGPLRTRVCGEVGNTEAGPGSRVWSRSPGPSPRGRSAFRGVPFSPCGAFAGASDRS
ncbi:hypothetical protein GZL_06230 [Streptomyces sp. 769]|nr:hypothetical protein GZL_06230 [Streptomyces sp. 769]